MAARGDRLRRSLKTLPASPFLDKNWIYRGIYLRMQELAPVIVHALGVHNACAAM